MVSQLFYELLSVSPDATLEEIKRAYHTVAKLNHPDLHPEAERGRYQLRMMRINEAYLAVLYAKKEAERVEPGSEPASRPEDARAEGEDRAVGPLKDPAYVYYKLGFRYFSEARRTFLKRYLQGSQRIDYTTESLDVLRLAVVSLGLFHRAYTCFLTVSRDYPESVWARDSEVKIYYLNRYNAIYQRICSNLSRQLKSEAS